MSGQLEEEIAYTVHRYIHPLERASIQGFRPHVFVGLTPSQVRKVVGNAFTVPVIGRLLHRCLLITLMAYASHNPWAGMSFPVYDFEALDEMEYAAVRVVGAVKRVRKTVAKAKRPAEAERSAVDRAAKARKRTVDLVYDLEAFDGMEYAAVRVAKAAKRVRGTVAEAKRPAVDRVAKARKPAVDRAALVAVARQALEALKASRLASVGSWQGGLGRWLVRKVL